MDKLTPFKHEHPIEGALCVFKTTNNLFILGYLKGMNIKQYGKNTEIPSSGIESFQPVINEQGGFIFIN